MKILYVSTAILPSHYANSVHVMKMCQALAINGHEVILIGEKGLIDQNVFDYYNVERNFRIEYVTHKRFKIFSKIYKIIKLGMKSDIVYTRYTIAALISTVLLRKETIYEYHVLMDRPVNKIIEAVLVSRKNLKHVFITNCLRDAYINRYRKMQNMRTLVLPDAADSKNCIANNFSREKLTCGYLGSFKKGKGVKLVVEIANRCENIEFHIIGGEIEEIKKLQEIQIYDNIVWHGHLNQKNAIEGVNKYIDIALLPNQKSIYVGKNGKTDIGSYTSPMKLFEYMSMKKIVIASNLDVLKEVIINDYNGLLVNATDSDDWVMVINKLQEDRFTYNRIRNQAYEDFTSKYTWKSRASKSLC